MPEIQIHMATGTSGCGGLPRVFCEPYGLLLARGRLCQEVILALAAAILELHQRIGREDGHGIGQNLAPVRPKVLGNGIDEVGPRCTNLPLVSAIV